MHTLFVDQITNIDFTYFDAFRGLVGETLIANLELKGNLNDDKMLWDFGEVKQYLKNTIEALFDHKLVVPAHSKRVKITTLNDHQLKINMLDDKNRQIEHFSPAIAVYQAPTDQINLEQLSTLLTQYTQKALKTRPLTPQVYISLHPETIEGAYYHYSHGLRQHQGACQRIAHGHRSRIMISTAGERAPSEERQWSDRWKDIYLGCESDIEDICVIDAVSYHCFKYTANEGEYALRIPSDKVDIVPNTSTIECIAQFIAETISTEQELASPHPYNKNIRVQAFEGLNKGAIYSL